MRFEDARAASAVMTDESIPPLRKVATGTSDCNCSATLFSMRLRKPATLSASPAGVELIKYSDGGAPERRC